MSGIDWIGALIVALACIAIPLVIVIRLHRSDMQVPHHQHFDVEERPCDRCDRYGFLLMSGAIVPRSMRKSASYGEVTDWVHSLAPITKPCPVCLGHGSYLVEKHETE